MKRHSYTALVILAAILLSACANTPPFPEENLAAVDQTLTPDQAVEQDISDARVLWGGVIIDAENKPDQTVFTVLNYPLDKSQRPNLQKAPLSRFKVDYPGYLETMLYAPGRRITVIGSLQGVEEGKVGDAIYRFAVVQAEKVYLWPQGDSDSRVRFGVGVGIGIHR